ncbi:MAG: hypothetical protein FJ109_14715 [Deltaproteobacteria bacterium]|nr:hypothetical protein [Deltaproteobacteria bacterium]
MPPSGLFVSVDVDSLDLYLSLYGKGGPGEAGTGRGSEAGASAASPASTSLAALTWELGVGRFLELFDELGISATFFTVGQDLRDVRALAVAKHAASAGHHLGNHTWSHPYHLIRLPASQAREEIFGGHEAIRTAVGVAPAIFRAPGYNMAPREYAILSELGYRFDSSPMPSFPYLLVKYAVLATLAVRGRKSGSIWGNPGNFLGPRRPYVRNGLTVLPCATTPGLRLPVLGTSLSTAPEPLFRYMLSSLRAERFAAIEFHAVDLMELAGDALPAPLAAQKDLHVPLARKRDRFGRFLGELAGKMGVWRPGTD